MPVTKSEVYTVNYCVQFELNGRLSNCELKLVELCFYVSNMQGIVFSRKRLLRFSFIQLFFSIMNWRYPNINHIFRSKGIANTGHIQGKFTCNVKVTNKKKAKEMDCSK